MARYSGIFWKNCATCDLWTGPREVEEATRTVQIDPAARGVCPSQAKNPVRYATSVCARWRQWASLASTAPGSLATGQ